MFACERSREVSYRDMFMLLEGVLLTGSTDWVQEDSKEEHIYLDVAIHTDPIFLLMNVKTEGKEIPLGPSSIHCFPLRAVESHKNLLYLKSFTQCCKGVALHSGANWMWSKVRIHI